MNLVKVTATPLMASGGLCAPLSPIYELPSFEVRAARPIREVLPMFTAARQDRSSAQGF